MSVSGRIPGEQSANDRIRDATGANAEKSQVLVTWLFSFRAASAENQYVRQAKANSTFFPARAASVMSMSMLNLSHLPRIKSLTLDCPISNFSAA
jgi:hypothetical protein